MNRSQYRIVDAEIAHLSSIPDIERAAARLFPLDYLPESLRELVTGWDVLQDAQADGRLWVSVDRAGKVVGFALADLLGGAAFLDELDVRPEHGRRGIGTRLVRVAAEWAREEGHASLSLLTFRDLPWNAPFYTSLGFRMLDEAELGIAIHERLQEERDAGIDTDKRVAMRLALRIRA